VNNGATLRLPKPHEIGIIFGSTFERMLRSAHEQDPRAFADFEKTILDKFIPVGLPTAAVPFIEHYTNRSMFFGNRLVPAYAENSLPPAQYSPNTTELSKALGKFLYNTPWFRSPLEWVNKESFLSPAVMENYVKAWSGGYGKYTLEAADLALRKAGVLPDPVKPAKTFTENPFIKGFFVRYPSANPQQILDFRTEFARAEKAANTLKQFQSRFKLDDYQEYLKRESILRDWESVAGDEGVHTAISNIGQLIQLITDDPYKPADKKREEIDGLYVTSLKMAQVGLKVLGTIQNRADAALKK
jgi:hypothetical protein